MDATPDMLRTASLPPSAAPSPAARTSSQSDGDSTFSFHDLLDIVNPLQHLPVIGTLYRAVTGDKIGGVEKIAGDALYGGVWGAVAAAADVAFQAVTGKDFGSTMVGLIAGDHDAAQTAIASADSSSHGSWLASFLSGHAHDHAAAATGAPVVTASTAVPATSAGDDATGHGWLASLFSGHATHHGDATPTRTASVTAPAITPVTGFVTAALQAPSLPVAPTSEMTALSASLSAKGFDSDLVQRALAAYQKTVGEPGGLVFATMH